MTDVSCLPIFPQMIENNSFQSREPYISSKTAQYSRQKACISSKKPRREPATVMPLRMCVPTCLQNTHTGWRRCTECLKSPVSFRKKASNYTDLLRKITYTDKASYGSSPPCILEVSVEEITRYAGHFPQKSH